MENHNKEHAGREFHQEKPPSCGECAFYAPNGSLTCTSTDYCHQGSAFKPSEILRCGDCAVFMEECVAIYGSHEQADPRCFKPKENIELSEKEVPKDTGYAGDPTNPKLGIDGTITVAMSPAKYRGKCDCCGKEYYTRFNYEGDLAIRCVDCLGVKEDACALSEDPCIGLIKALKFYASDENYNGDGAPYTERTVEGHDDVEHLDLGDIAKDALSEIGMAVYDSCEKCEVQIERGTYRCEKCKGESK